MLLLDVSHTSHTTASTGIQRVCRKLYAELVSREMAVPVVYDLYAVQWRKLDANEHRLMTVAPDEMPALKRKARWSKFQRWRGRWWRIQRKHPLRLSKKYEGLLVPEFFNPESFMAYSKLRPICGPQVAVFHDMIALHLPQFSPVKTQQRYPGYLKELAQFDGIAADSEFSRTDIIAWWGANGISRPPPSVTIHLASDPVSPVAQSPKITQATKKVLCVCSVEGRKNHLSLLQAAERLWDIGMTFELHLAGMVNRETGSSALEKIHQLQAAHRPVIYHGAVTDAALVGLHRESWCTIQASLMEGYGLPIIESLRHGVPCITTPGGSLAEVAAGGGCLILENASVEALVHGMQRLLTDSALYDKLVAEIPLRTFRTWWDYARELSQFCQSLHDSA